MHQLPKYKILDHTEVSYEQWHSFVQKMDNASAFHTSVIFKVYANVPYYDPFALFAIDSDGCCQGILTGYIQTVKPGLFSSLTRRAILMQSPIFSDLQALESLLLCYSYKFSNKVVYTEIRNHVDTIPYNFLYSLNGFVFDDHLDIYIKLDQSAEDLLKAMHSTRRRQINRGIKRGVSVSIIPNLDEENLLKCVMIVQELYKRINLPVPSSDLIMSAAFNSDDMCKFVCFAIKFDEEIIGTRMVLCFKQLIYDWYASSKVEHYDKYPNDILVWEVLKWGNQNGFKMFDFGGAGKPGVPYGVRDYKLKFGGTIVNFGRYHKKNSQLKYFIAKNGFHILHFFKKIKLIYKNLFIIKKYL